MTKHKSKVNEGRSARLLFVGLTGLGLVFMLMLKNADVALLNPKGWVAGEQYNLMLLTTAILLLIAVPTVFLFYYFAWKYRETNEKATYDPNMRFSKFFMFSLWAIPMVFMVVLSVIMWKETQRLEPKDPIASNVKPMTVQVVALPWKWLFIYPEQKIATVNFVQIPTGTPIEFKLTADRVSMSSFWIPHLSGQLYAMTGHVNQLNVIADTPGDYRGSSAEINGEGFAGMKFVTRAVSQEEFDTWTGSVQQSFVGLGDQQYEKLLQPSENHPYEYYSTPVAGLYDKVVMKYTGSHNHQDTASNAKKHTGH